MADLSTDVLFDAAVRMLLLERSITISFAADRIIRIRFPITRRIAEFLGIPHYSILRSFALLEKDELVMREERVGIVTTRNGTRKMIDLMMKKYRQEAEGILGIPVLEDLVRKTR